MENLAAIDEALEKLLAKLHKINRLFGESVRDIDEIAQLYRAANTLIILLKTKLLIINKDFQDVGAGYFTDVTSKCISKLTEMERFHNSAYYQLAINAAYEMETEFKKLDELRKTGRVEIDIGTDYAGYVLPASISIFGRTILAPPPPPIK